MTATQRPIGPAALRQALDQARVARQAAARRIAILEKRLGIAPIPAHELVAVIADLYGDTPEITARRRTLLAQDARAMGGKVKEWRTASRADTARALERGAAA